MSVKNNTRGKLITELPVISVTLGAYSAIAPNLSEYSMFKAKSSLLVEQHSNMGEL